MSKWPIIKLHAWLLQIVKPLALEMSSEWHITISYLCSMLCTTLRSHSFIVSKLLVVKVLNRDPCTSLHKVYPNGYTCHHRGVCDMPQARKGGALTAYPYDKCVQWRCSFQKLMLFVAFLNGSAVFSEEDGGKRARRSANILPAA